MLTTHHPQHRCCKCVGDTAKLPYCADNKNVMGRPLPLHSSAFFLQWFVTHAEVYVVSCSSPGTVEFLMYKLTEIWDSTLFVQSICVDAAGLVVLRGVEFIQCCCSAVEVYLFIAHRQTQAINKTPVPRKSSYFRLTVGRWRLLPQSTATFIPSHAESPRILRSTLFSDINQNMVVIHYRILGSILFPKRR